MRVISGLARGTQLYTLDGLETRPTLDRVKESLFSMIQIKIPDSNILDLFSGSGALGIESLSRGGKKAVLCDKSRHAISIIQKNIEKTKLQDKVEVLNKDYQKCLELLKQRKEEFDIIFIDPPYQLNIAVKAVEKILEYHLLAKDGIIILETDEEQRELEQLESLEINIYDRRKYGRVKLIFLS